MTVAPARPGLEPRFAQRVRGLRGSPIGELDALTAGRSGLIPLAGGTPHVGDVAVAEIARLFEAEIEAEPRLLLYGLTEGEKELRATLLDFGRGRGDGEHAPAELIVTTGAMQAIDLLAKLFIDPGDLVLVESPTFSDALAVFSAYEARVAEVPIDEHGIVVEAIPEIVARAGAEPKLIYVVPTFQNPTGVSMTEDRRRKLMELNRRYHSVLIDDDPYRLLRYRGTAIPSLRSLAGPQDRVVAIRSGSKLIAPGLRVGWALGPPHIVAAMIRAKQGVDICTSAIAQRVVAAFFANGFEAHLARLTETYAGRLAATTAALEREFAGTGLRWHLPEGGYFMWITLPDEQRAEQLLPLALDEGVTFVPGDAFSTTGQFASQLRLCFVAVPEPQLIEGVARLRAGYARLHAGSR